MAVFGPNILIILGGSKSSGTHISENHLGTMFALFFWSRMVPNGSERPIFCPKWPNMHILGQIWAKILIFWRGKNGCLWAKHPNYFGREQKLWYSHIRKPTMHLVPIVYLARHSIKMDQKGKYLAQNDQNCHFLARLGRFCANNPNF